VALLAAEEVDLLETAALLAGLLAVHGFRQAVFSRNSSTNNKFRKQWHTGFLSRLTV